MANICQKCGFSNDEGATLCASCGTPMPVNRDNQAYLKGMIYLRNYTIIGFISLAAGLIMDFVFIRTLSYGYLIGPLGAAFGGVTLSTSNIGHDVVYTEIALVVSAVLTLIGLYMLFVGFNILKTLENEFSLGRTGAILEFVGMILVVIGIIGLLGILLPIVNLGSTSSPATLAQSEIGAIVGIGFLILVAAILLLIGVIMVLIGIYRVGNHFDNSIVKVGAILTLFLGIVGTILLFIGFTDIINRMRKGGDSPE